MMLFKVLLGACLAWVGSSFSGWYSVVGTGNAQRVAVCQGDDDAYYWAFHDQQGDAFWGVTAMGSGVEADDGMSFSNSAAGNNGEGKGGGKKSEHVVLYFEEMADIGGTVGVSDDREAIFSMDGEGGYQLNLGQSLLYDLQLKGDMPTAADCFQVSSGDALQMPFVVRSDITLQQGSHHYFYFDTDEYCYGRYKEGKNEFFHVGGYDYDTYVTYMDGKRTVIEWIEYTLNTDACNTGYETHTQITDDLFMISWQCSDGSSGGRSTYALRVVYPEYPFEVGCPMDEQ